MGGGGGWRHHTKRTETGPNEDADDDDDAEKVALGTEIGKQECAKLGNKSQKWGEEQAAAERGREKQK